MSTEAQPRKNETYMSPSHGESGQAAISLVLMLGLFLLAAMAFSVDLVNMWFHRQAAQTGADAACQAGAMNMLDAVSGITMANMGFTVGTAGDCIGSPAATICKYAGFNGYKGTGYTSTTAGNTVSWTFPASVPGITAPSTSVTTKPFLQVTVTENVKTWFMGLLGIKYQKVSTVSTCGLVPVRAAPPLVVLNPSVSSSLSQGGSATVSVIGGPQRSLQVNSTSSTAIYLGGSSALNFSSAGPAGTGGDLGVVGGPSTKPVGYNGGTTGRWLSPSSPLPDPYGSVPAPARPALCTQCSGTSVPHYWDGCPDPVGCTEYSPGYYPSGITIKQNTAIFLPGLYYLGADFSAQSLSTVRNGWTYHSTVAPVPAPSAADGVMFYLTNGAGIFFGSNSGSSTLDPLPSSYLLCNSSQKLPSGVPSTLNGSILWAQCTTNGTYDNFANTSTHSPDTQSTDGSRGLLMFLDHSSSPPKNLSAGGGGSMAFAGAFYFHQATSYGDIFSLGGGSGTGTYVIGKIVADQLNLGGGGSITMALSNDPSTYLLKTGIFQ